MENNVSVGSTVSSSLSHKTLWTMGEMRKTGLGKIRQAKKSRGELGRLTLLTF